MFVDVAKIHLKAGKGGDGRVSFRREKYVPDGGPNGGDGGRGGNIVFEVDPGMRTLMDFRYKLSYHADDGDDGGKKRSSGKSAKDLVLKVPPGTIVKDEKTGKIIVDLSDDIKKAIIAKAGKGGRGNLHFKSSVRQAPTFAEQGFYGEERDVILELKMLADVGLVGYPNVGKSTMLSSITKAKPKIANYHFTTLFPNLGVVEVIKGKSFVLADIPGLIDGAHEGVGLGHDFLRHVERTKLIIHVVDVSGIEGRDPEEDFESINNELFKYSEKLSDRTQIIAANKTDLVYDDGKYKDFIVKMEEKGYEVFPISAVSGKGIKELMLRVTELLETIEDVEIYSDDDMFVYEEDDKFNEIDYKVIDGVYVVDGIPIERLVYSTDFEDIDSVRRFQSMLTKKGVIDTLREMGIEEGDTVRIFDFEFEFYN
ncbi:GTPase ObgE [Helicovermis profundi]|uniref:GTPase Obg n=1 Tax=Helicovermis profundi TaxID=3065157 RepID=A0AAU9EXY2_9FIRM|nr:GTPase ObgE [Clostridia bacterium S502]